MGNLLGIGHVGLFVGDLERSRSFFRDLIGLTVTDEVAGGPVFMSSRPQAEHHELVLVSGRQMPEGARVLQQLSFRCASLEAVIDYYKRLRAARVRMQQVVSHGNAVGVYFFDPDGNRCEIYWDTGRTCRQPFMEAIDLARPIADILAQVDAGVAAHGTTGLEDRESIARQLQRWAEEDAAR